MYIHHKMQWNFHFGKSFSMSFKQYINVFLAMIGYTSMISCYNYHVLVVNSRNI